MAHHRKEVGGGPPSAEAQSIVIALSMPQAPIHGAETAALELFSQTTLMHDFCIRRILVYPKGPRMIEENIQAE